MLNDNDIITLGKCLPFWNALTVEEKRDVRQGGMKKDYRKGDTLLHGGRECTGLVTVEKGQLRAFINSPDGKEITLYRLLPGDVCIMTASCMLKNLNTEIILEMETDSTLLILPT